MLLPVYFLLVAVVITLIAAIIDFRTGEIPNALTLGPLAIAPLVHAALGYHNGGLSGAGWGFGYAALGAVGCGIAPVLVYVVGGMGGGDVKLLAALGALLWPMLGLEAEFYAFLGAALFAPAKMAYEGKLLRTLGNTLALAVNPFLPKAKRREIAPEMMTSLRFGPAIFVGTCVAAYLNWRA
jgi:prepilin peptidase CpaA